MRFDYRLAALVLAALALLTLSACGGTAVTEEDLVGYWEQDSTDATFYQVAEITEDAVRVWWHLTEDDSEYLYWSGSFTPPADGAIGAYKWTSENNLAEARHSAWARREEAMNFTYKDGQLVYVVFMGNLRMSVALDKK